MLSRRFLWLLLGHCRQRLAARLSGWSKFPCSISSDVEQTGDLLTKSADLVSRFEVSRTRLWEVE